MQRVSELVHTRRRSSSHELTPIVLGQVCVRAITLSTIIISGWRWDAVPRPAVQRLGRPGGGGGEQLPAGGLITGGALALQRAKLDLFRPLNQAGCCVVFLWTHWAAGC